MTKIIIYTTPYCPYCVRAKQLLQHKGLDFEEIDLSMSAELRQTMQQLSGRNTVPQIFINDQPIGGCDELFALDRKQLLDKLLLV